MARRTSPAEVAAADADVEVELDRREARRSELEVVAGEAVPRQLGANQALEGRPKAGQARRAGLDVGRVGRVDADEDRVPAAGPAERRDRAGHLGKLQRGGAIVGLGDRPELLGAEGVRRQPADLLDGLGVDAAGRRERVADGLDPARSRSTRPAARRGTATRARRCRRARCRRGRRPRTPSRRRPSGRTRRRRTAGSPVRRRRSRPRSSCRTACCRAGPAPASTARPRRGTWREPRQPAAPREARRSGRGARRSAGRSSDRRRGRPARIPCVSGPRDSPSR